jgi:putative DNA primase/helicase
MALAGVSPTQLTNRHQPCPACAGTDRYRWDRDDGPGGWFCSHCGGRNHQGGGGTGMDLLLRLTGWTFPDTCRRIEAHLGLPSTARAQQRRAVSTPPPSRRQSPERTAWELLSCADALSADDQAFSPARAKGRHYTTAWAAFQQANPDAADAATYEHSTARGISEPPPGTTPPEPPRAQPFQLLGFDVDGGYYYIPRNTGLIVRLSAQSHTSTNLLRLTEKAYWEALYPSKTGIDWASATSDLFAQQAAVGMYDADRLRGRGAWWDNGRPILHLGDRIITPSGTISISESFPSSNHYQRGPALAGPGNSSPLTDEEALALLTIANRFHWDVPVSAQLLAGWIVLAPICGALRWRPLAWLTAAAGTGKSVILDRFVHPLLGDMRQIIVGNSTEAGIRQLLRSDALPVVLDEAESNEKSDQVRIQQVLSLARVASSESEAFTVKGSPSGDVSRFKVRSMFLLCSISTALKQGADRRRFCQLTLRSPSEMPSAERELHWQALDHELDRVITREYGARLLARSIPLIPMIRQAIATFTTAAARHFDSQALGDQYGALLAGAWALQSSTAPTDAEAQMTVSGADWSSHQQTAEVPDERRCLNRILQHPLRVETDERTLTRTIGELIQRITTDSAAVMDAVAFSDAEDLLSRHGIRVIDGRLLVSNTAEAIARILADTAWANSWATILRRLPGAVPHSVPVRFKGYGAAARACSIPLGDD